jgi:UDP-GlcNAc:undecaprenyl-phosphate/decaprenyl-phosphate GlcNAc-1-phosphate transferase
VRRLLGCAASGVAAALLALVANQRAAQSEPPSRWLRTSYSGASVTLAEGPIAVAALLAGTTIERLLDASGRTRTPVVVASLGAGLFGAYDDFYGSTHAKGFGGHLRALRSGELTSGMIKVFGVGASAAVAAILVQRSRPACPKLSSAVLNGLLDTALIATAANLINLLDLRPGRAPKVIILLGSGVLGHGAAPAVGAAAGSLPTDLGGRSMLGDCGANALGAAVATAAAQALPWQLRLVAFAAVAALNLASERVSFTAVIERTPLLRRLDDLGRPGRVMSMSTNDQT